MRAIATCLMAGAATVPAWGQPQQWIDDFKTTTTYDSSTFYSTCNGGPSPKCTIVEVLLGDIYGQNAYVRGGTFAFNTRSLEVITPSMGRKEFVVFGWYGVGIECPGNPPSGTTDTPFTSSDICIYGAIRMNPWQTHFQTAGIWDIRGPDYKPGRADVDDDLNSTTLTPWPFAQVYVGQANANPV